MNRSEEERLEVITAEGSLPPPTSGASMEGAVRYPTMPAEGAALQPVAPPDEILLPAPQLTVPAVRERQFPIRHTDWLQLRRKVTSLSDPLPNLANLGWACVGIAATAASAYFPWMAADSQLMIKAQQHDAYIAPLLSIVSIASIVIAFFSFFVNSKMAKMRTTSVKNVLADMDAIYKPHEMFDAENPPTPAEKSIQSGSRGDNSP